MDTGNLVGSPLHAQAIAGQGELQAAATMPEFGQWKRLMGEYLSDTWRVCAKNAQSCKKTGSADKAGTGLVFGRPASTLSASNLTHGGGGKAANAVIGSHGVPMDSTDGNIQQSSAGEGGSRTLKRPHFFICLASHFALCSPRARPVILATLGLLSLSMTRRRR